MPDPYDPPFLPDEGQDQLSRRVWELAHARDEQALRELFESGVSANHRCEDYGRPILHAPIHARSARLTRLFLGYGADANAIDDGGETPLHDAVRWSSVAVANVLLRRGARTDLAESQYGNYPLHIAAERGEVTKLSILLNHGAEVDCRRLDGETPLHRAAYYGKTLAVRRLLSAGADMLTQDFEGFEAFHHACLGGHPAVIKLLLQRGASSTRRSGNGTLPLSAATGRDSVEAFQLVVRAGGAAELTDDDKLGLLTLSVVAGGPILDAVLDLGVPVDLRPESGQSPLEWAIANNKTEVIEQLRQRGAI